jgi:hypothetical protein
VHARLDRQRYLAILFVGALHVLIIEILIRAPHSQFLSADNTAWSTLLFMPTAPVPPPAPANLKPKKSATLARPNLQAPVSEAAFRITAAPDSTPSKSAIDWTSGLSKAAGEVVGSQGAPGASVTAAPAKPDARWTPRVHSYREQYPLSTGELVVWVSDRCFVVSEPAPADTPNAFAHSALTHTQCARDPGPRADLFKQLPAYDNIVRHSKLIGDADVAMT